VTPAIAPTRRLATLSLLVLSPWVILAVALSVRVAGLFWTSRYAMIMTYNDGWVGEASRIGASLAAGNGFSSPFYGLTGPTAWLMPVYPLLVSAVFKAAGIYSPASLSVLGLCNCVFGAATVLPLYAFSRRAFGLPTAVGAAWAWALYPPLLFVERFVWDTSLATLAIVVLLWATLQMEIAGHLRRWVGYGLLWGVALLINVSPVLVAPCLWGWLAYRRSQCGETNRWVVIAGAAAAVACLMPWAVRNYLVFGKAVVLRSNLAFELRQGNNSALRDRPRSVELHPYRNPEEMRQYRELGEMAYIASKKQEFTEFVKHEPTRFAFLTARRVYYWWVGGGAAPPPLDKVAGVLSPPFLLTALGLAGLVAAWRARVSAAVPIGMVLFVFPTVFYFTHVEPRYRHPLTPFFLTLAVHALVRACAKHWPDRSLVTDPGLTQV
jgi:hypothetical protein